ERCFGFISLCSEKMKKEILMERIVIRNERPDDYQIVEEITREAFYNIYVLDVWSTIWFM
ncbi:MAG: hypothetical protein ACLUD8_12595, partial [Clostridium sp.]